MVAVASQWVPRDHLHGKLEAEAALSSLETGPRLPQIQQAPTTGPDQKVSQDDAHDEHDPHALPDFDKTSLTAPSHPILYLPPLLSKLPEGYSYQVDHSSKNKPLSTDTHLPDIDPASLQLHKALHKFQPVTGEYAETSYEEAFNWDELELPEDAEREWYAVVFRSKRKEGSDGGPLYQADRLAHEEAVHNGGLILYWYGIPHPETGLNLATCIWQSRKHAIAANSQPHHISAMRLAAASYERYELRRYRLSKIPGERTLRVAPYDGGDVGW
ncbi:hypothetical protein PsYK624_111460 [Phanerochaete sordida]|uniref:Uncharacterized protein n=1 Tax=Phanerochaete sordida TaxID=48140 RepID=A0A9P3GK31_9APHY|nr:hypothetical protein PsYK624_111460 [Phanerochaete sordida]